MKRKDDWCSTTTVLSQIAIIASGRSTKGYLPTKSAPPKNSSIHDIKFNVTMLNYEVYNYNLQYKLLHDEKLKSVSKNKNEQ